MMSDENTKYSEYWESVAALAQEASEQRNPHEYISEAVDQSWWIIYNHAARAVMQHTTNDDAAFEAMGSTALEGCDTFDAVVVRCAYFAMVADVEEALSSVPEPDNQVDDD